MVDRESLTQIIEDDGGMNWWVPERFKKNVLHKLPHDLQIVYPPPPEQVNYNCFVYALGLQDDPDYLGGKNPVQQEFIKYLIKREVLLSADKKADNLIFYEDEKGNITHGGLLIGEDEVISKWMWGPIFVHKIWDVPSSFGNQLHTFSQVSVDEIKDVYEKYKNSGINIRPIT